MHSGIQIPHAVPSSSASRSHRNHPHSKVGSVSAHADEESEISELVKAGEILVQLAERHKKSKDNALAEVCYLRALDIFSKGLPSYHPKTAATRDNLAMLYRDRGQVSVAESLQRTALDDLRRHYDGAPHQDVARAMRNLAETCLLGGKVQEGLNMLRDAVSMTTQICAEDHVVEITRYQQQVLARLG
jgi:hypothetical protein